MENSGGIVRRLLVCVTKSSRLTTRRTIIRPGNGFSVDVRQTRMWTEIRLQLGRYTICNVRNAVGDQTYTSALCDSVTQKKCGQFIVNVTMTASHEGASRAVTRMPNQCTWLMLKETKEYPAIFLEPEQHVFCGNRMLIHCSAAANVRNQFQS